MQQSLKWRTVFLEAVFFRIQRTVLLHFLNQPFGVFKRIMFQTAIELSNLGFLRQHQRLMHLTVGKTGKSAMVKARNNIRIPAAAFNQSAVVMVQTGKRKNIFLLIF